MTLTEVIIEIIYTTANVLFPFAILFFIGGLVYDISRRNKNKVSK